VQKKHFYIVTIFLLLVQITFAQKEEIIKEADTLKVNTNELDILAPSKAAFYSAILPGLGQAYNKKYWKIPIVYGVLGTSTYFYIKNNDDYNRARDAFKLMKEGKPHEFDGVDGNILLSEDALIRAQERFKKDRDLSLLVTVGLYALQILEASVNAHLQQHNVDNNLSLRPKLIKDDLRNKSIVGASINFKF
jgi:hypothetical protein